MNSTLEKLAEEYELPYLPEITTDQLPKELLPLLPLQWAKDFCVIPIQIEEKLHLAMSKLENFSIIQQASLLLNKELEPAFAPKECIISVLEKLELGAAADIPHADNKKNTTCTLPQNNHNPPATTHTAQTNFSDLLSDSDNQPITQFINNIILEAIRRDASDIHLEPEENGAVRIRYRLDGKLYDYQSSQPNQVLQIVSRIKVMSNMDITERRLPQDGMTQVRVANRIVDIRVSTIPVATGERVVLRLLNRDRSLLPLNHLGMPNNALEGFSNALNQPNGIIVVSGPTGSGKTTTLYSALGTMDSIRRNILTIEDPIEYRIPNIAQIQVKPKIGLTFASGLRHILRQDPDVILVGETRDAETAEIAVRSSLTGHLVLTTLHTNDAPAAVMRLTDMGIEPYLLASCLRGVLAQRLVRCVCPHCHEIADISTLPPHEAAIAEAAGAKTIAIAKGCPKCREGFIGRIGIFEFMPCTPNVAAAIHSGKLSANELRNIVANEPTWCAMKDDAAQKLRNHITTPAELIASIGQF
jgi:type II secretory ATPase GspE/PulE/Tfp pilus assembly ATPase PilB-like protein